MPLGDLVMATQHWMCFFKNAKMIDVFSPYTKFFTKPPRNIREELNEEVTLEMSREEHKNMKMQYK